MSRIPTPSFDLSRLDLNALAGLDTKVITVARDAAYIGIGFGVLAFQQAQVRRRELEKTIAARVDAGRGQLDDLVRNVTRRVK
ncbi:MAG: hypothetical protein Q7V57_10385 [Actinomycetota bacterium]|nr:hypothetical protein [Actinomycetota bacterium]